MFISQRDMNIEHIHTKGTYCSGLGLGVILLDETYPGFPGDVRNPSAFPYPVQYEVASNLDIDGLIYDDNREKYLPAIMQAARRLEKMGCRAILGECGYFGYFQEEVAAAVNVPVFMSSLLQVPWAQSILSKDKVIGLLMSGAEDTLNRHLERCGIVLGSNYVIGGVMDGGKCEQFHTLWGTEIPQEKRGAYYSIAEKDFLQEAVSFFKKYPNMGAMVLECTGFPPFARALQQAIDIPIFSWGTLMDFAFQVTSHRDYYGVV